MEKKEREDNIIQTSLFLFLFPNSEKRKES